MNAIGLGALQQRHMPERWRNRLEHRHQVAQHHVIGADLVWIAPAIDQVRRLIERGVDEMGCALQRRCGLRALRRIGQVDSRRGGRRRARAACAATALQLRIRRRRRSAAMRHFPPAPSRPRPRLSCLAIARTPARELPPFTSRRRQATSARDLSLSSCQGWLKRSVFRQFFATAVEPEPLIIDTDSSSCPRSIKPGN